MILGLYNYWIVVILMMIILPIVPSCFFCQKPQLNEWMHVKTKGLKRVEYPGDGPITVWGTLSVGLKVEDGFPVNLFRLEAEGVKALPTEGN